MHYNISHNYNYIVIYMLFKNWCLNLLLDVYYVIFSMTNFHIMDHGVHIA